MLRLVGIQVMTLRRGDEIQWAVSEACRTVYGASKSVALILARELTGGKDE